VTTIGRFSKEIFLIPASTESTPGSCTYIHKDHANIPLNKEAILSLHKSARGDIWDAGH